MYGIKDEKTKELEDLLYYWGVLHGKTLAKELLKRYELMSWVTDREPSEAECDYAGDTGFILCISGQYENMGYDRAIVMSECFYEEGQWFVSGIGVDSLTIHGWMLPPDPPVIQCSEEEKHEDEDIEDDMDNPVPWMPYFEPNV